MLNSRPEKALTLQNFGMNQQALQRLLQRAQILCEQRGVRLTAQRQQVLRLLAEHAGAISAYDLLDKLRQSEPQAKPPTVYRALDFLLEQGFVHKVESVNSFVLCSGFEEHVHHTQLFICDQCGCVNECRTEAIDHTLATVAAELGFTIKHRIVEVHGTCALCSASHIQ